MRARSARARAPIPGPALAPGHAADELRDGNFEGVDVAVVLDWTTRSERLLAEVQAAGADVLSLVECDHYADFWVPRLAALGYAAVCHAVKHAPGPGAKTHGVALFARTAVFSVRAWHTACVGVAAAQATLRHVESGEHVVVLATHLKAKASGEAQRAAQLQALVRMLQWPGAGGSRLIVMGDFNASLDEEAVWQFTAETQLRSASACAWTTWKRRVDRGEVRRTIDYVLVRDLHATRYLDVPGGLTVPLLTAGYPSDHLLVAVEFTFD